jgi:uncharacterized membrane protein
MAIASAGSILLLVVRFIRVGNFRFTFMIWNLFLAWLPLLFAWLLAKELIDHSWTSRRCLVLAALWLVFLPNSFYIVSDLIHIHSSANSMVLYDVSMLSLFTFTGFALGFASLLLVHWELLRRTTRQRAHAAVGVMLLLCSFAIYLGRDLRWNSWDILVNPFGLIIDISERLFNPGAHGSTFLTTFTFFVLLSTSYIVVWRASRFLQSQGSRS